MNNPAASQATLDKQGAQGQKYIHTQALLIQMLNILLNFPGNLSPPVLLSKQIRMNGSTASFKYIMRTFIFSLLVENASNGLVVTFVLILHYINTHILIELLATM